MAATQGRGQHAAGARVPRNVAATADGIRLQEARTGASWRLWGPYVSDRQWGGRCARTTAPTAMLGNIFSHEHARSRAYRWGEDGLAGFGDEHLDICMAAGFRGTVTTRSSRERLFGLTNSEGITARTSRSSDYYLDGTPT